MRVKPDGLYLHGAALLRKTDKVLSTLETVSLPIYGNAFGRWRYNRFQGGWGRLFSLSLNRSHKMFHGAADAFRFEVTVFCPEHTVFGWNGSETGAIRAILRAMKKSGGWVSATLLSVWAEQPGWLTEKYGLPLPVHDGKLLLQLKPSVCPVTWC